MKRDTIIIFIIKILNFRVEKYRPSTLDDLVSHEDIIKTGKWIFKIILLK